MDKRSAIAAIRFGLGRRPNDPVPSDPLVWLDRQIGPPAPIRTGPGMLPPLSFREAVEFHFAATDRQADGRRSDDGRRDLLKRVDADAVSWTGHCLLSDAPFQDRLTNFWANHFTISRRIRIASIFIGPYLRETVRPLMFGKFADLVVETARNPGMITYLSNSNSVGPNSPAAKQGQRGLNENLAREILELHTVTPAAGYSQADVTSFARVLTGWTVERNANGAGFVFRERTHEPGPKVVLGKTFPEGYEGGVAALRYLAEHPAAHRHVATQLVRHFVADDPPKAAVDKLYGVMRDTRGDLGETTRALIRLPEAWDPPLSKVRAPLDYVLSCGRALGLGSDQADDLHRAMAQLGQPLWNASQPVGWPDIAEEWAVPEALLHRIEWAHTTAGRAGRRDPRAIIDTTLGPLASADILREAGRAGSPQDAVTLVLVSPEFQRR